MIFWRSFVQLLICCMSAALCGNSCLAAEMQQEYVTTTPVLADGVLYIASTTFPIIAVICGPSICSTAFLSPSGMLLRECL